MKSVQSGGSRVRQRDLSSNPITLEREYFHFEADDEDPRRRIAREAAISAAKDRDFLVTGVGVCPRLTPGPLTPEQRVAVEAYDRHDFPSLPLHVKQRILSELPALTSTALAKLEGFHFPRSFTHASTPRPITFTLAAGPERTHENGADILGNYAPDPSGRLDPTILKDCLWESAKLSPVLARCGSQYTSNTLRWKDLTPPGRKIYLEALWKRDGAVTLHRIDDVKFSPYKNLAPTTFKKELMYVGRPIQVREVLSDEPLTSLDQVVPQISFLGHFLGTPASLRAEIAFDLPAAELKEVSPKITALVALLDLQMIVELSACPRDPSSLELIQPAAAMRVENEGDRARMVIELRGAAKHNGYALREQFERATAIISGGNLDALLPVGSKQTDKVDPRIAQALEKLRPYATDAARYGGDLAVPLWDLESMLALAPGARQGVARERQNWIQNILRLSAYVEAQERAGLPVDKEYLEDTMTRHLTSFFDSARIRYFIRRRLDEAQTPPPPESRAGRPAA